MGFSLSDLEIDVGYTGESSGPRYLRAEREEMMLRQARHLNFGSRVETSSVVVAPQRKWVVRPAWESTAWSCVWLTPESQVVLGMEATAAANFADTGGAGREG